MKKINLVSEFKDAWEVIKLNDRKIKKIAQDKKTTKTAIFFIALSVLAALLGFRFFPIAQMGVYYRPSWPEVATGFLTGLLITLIVIYIINLIVQKLFKGEAKFEQFLRPVGYGQLIGVLRIFPLLSLIAAIWGLLIIFHILRVVHKLKTKQAVLLIVLLILGYLVFLSLVARSGMLELIGQ